MKNIVTSQERRNYDLAATNTSLRKQLAESQVREKDLKKRCEAHGDELVAEKFMREAVEKELASQLKQMKTIAIDATLHARAELIKELKARKQGEWDPDYEIGVWREREVELTRMTGDAERVEDPMSLRIDAAHPAGMEEDTHAADEPREEEQIGEPTHDE